MSSSWKYVKSPRADRAFRELARLAELVAAVVIQDRAYARPGRSAAQVARWHEFGTSRMPARPFLREAERRGVTSLKAILAQGVHDIIESDRRADTAMQHVAQAMGSLAIDAINSSPSWAKPLAPYTIAKKGHSHPLIETGLMREAVRWRVSRRGATVREGRPR